MAAIILVRGAGDLATGVAIRLIRAGLRVVMTEVAEPLAVRRSVVFSEAVFRGETVVEGITAHLVDDPTDSLSILTTFARQKVPVLVDPDCASARFLHPVAIIDARMTKLPPQPIGYSPSLYIGLGPGFSAGVNCQAVIETRRGHHLGRVYWQGVSAADTGLPDGDPARLLRAPENGTLSYEVEIGQHVEVGQIIARINTEVVVHAPFNGVLRGMLRTGTSVTQGMKIGDVDPRDDPELCCLVSDKALALGGAVLEALLAKPEVRASLWS